MKRLLWMIPLFSFLIACSPTGKMADPISEDYLESLYAEAEEVVYVHVLNAQALHKLGQKAIGYTINKISCQIKGNLKGSLMLDSIFTYHNFIEGDRTFPAFGERIVFLIRSDSWEEQNLWMAIENADFAYTKKLWKTLEHIARKRNYQ